MRFRLSSTRCTPHPAHFSQSTREMGHPLFWSRFLGCAGENKAGGTRDISLTILFAYFFFMFIGLLLSWQRPECSRDLRFE
jgi:hypothetical protein